MSWEENSLVRRLLGRAAYFDSTHRDPKSAALFREAVHALLRTPAAPAPDTPLREQIARYVTRLAGKVQDDWIYYDTLSSGERFMLREPKEGPAPHWKSMLAWEWFGGQQADDILALVEPALAQRYREGAEAMREAAVNLCTAKVDHSHKDDVSIGCNACIEVCAREIRALPLPTGDPQ